MMARALFAVFFALLAVPAWAQVQQQFDLNPAASNAASSAPANLGLVRSATKSYGMVGDGTTDNTTAFAAMMAATDSPTVYFPAGTYLLSCPTGPVTAASAISMIGAGSGAVTLKLPASCTLPANDAWLSWDNVSGFTLSGFTLNLNGANGSGSFSIPLRVRGMTAPADNWRIHDISITNGGTALLELGVVGGTSGTHNWSIDHNYFAINAASTNLNQGISTSVLGGVNSHATVADNVSVNTAIQFCGDHSVVSGNQISGWNFGSGIYLPPSTSCPGGTNNVVSNNNIHDGGTALDVNTTASSGIEAHSDETLISSNLLSHNGGYGVINAGANASIVSNTAIDNGQRQDGHGAAAFANYYIASGNSGDGSVFVDNVAIDTGGDTQKWCYDEPLETVAGKAYVAFRQCQPGAAQIGAMGTGGTELDLPPIQSSGTAITNTGIGTSEVSLASIHIPPLAADDSVEITALWNTTGTAADTKQIVIRLGASGCISLTACNAGTAVFTETLNTSSLISYYSSTTVRNAHATNAQVFQNIGGANASFGSAAVANGTSAVQTNGGSYVNIDCTTSTASTDSCSLVAYTIKIIPGNTKPAF